MLKMSIVAACLSSLLALPVYAQETNIPDLKGKWEATSQVHSKVHGHIKTPEKNGELVILSQEGRVFHGTVIWNNKAPGKDNFSGVIDKDGVTFYVAGHTDGTRIGKMEGKDAFTFYFLAPGGDNPRAGFAEYKRVK